jgi:hypothetical protein
MKYSHILSIAAISTFFTFMPTMSMEPIDAASDSMEEINERNYRTTTMRRSSTPVTTKTIEQSNIKNLNKKENNRKSIFSNKKKTSKK